MLWRPSQLEAQDDLAGRAQRIIAEVSTDKPALKHDGSTNALIRRYRAWRGR